MSCSGACCAAFPISSPLDEIGPNTEDGLTLLDMLEPISYEEACARWDRYANGDRPDTPAARYYRCNRWDPETRLCTRYDERPSMCRDYPYGRACEHGCDCRAARPVALLCAGSPQT